MRRWIAFLLLTGVIASCDGGGSDGSTTATPGTQTLPASTSTMPKQESSTTTTSTTTTTKAIAEGGVLVTLVDRGVSEWWLAAEADSNGFPVVAYMTEDGSVQVLRCRGRELRERCRPIENRPYGRRAGIRYGSAPGRITCGGSPILGPELRDRSHLFRPLVFGVLGCGVG